MATRKASRTKQQPDVVDEQITAPPSKRKGKGKDVVEPVLMISPDIILTNDIPAAVQEEILETDHQPEPQKEHVEDNNLQSSEPVVTIPPSSKSTAWSVPKWSYFEVRSDSDKRMYVECFAEIIGRVKTNYHFRCKGCDESFLGQYLNMLVHMAGTNNHVRARTRACKKPILPVRARILADFEAYNAKEQHALSLLRGAGQMPAVPTPAKRGRKRSFTGMLQSVSQHLPSSAGHHRQTPRHALWLTTPPGAAVYENCCLGNANRTATAAVITEGIRVHYSHRLQQQTAEFHAAEWIAFGCTSTPAPPLPLRQLFENIHRDVQAQSCGCGLVIPELLQGQRVLDLGCGAGRDCYVLSQLVGEHGTVVGLDMSTTLLGTARATQDWHRARFGYASSNVRFVQYWMETLREEGSGERAEREERQQSDENRLSGVAADETSATLLEATVEHNTGDCLDDGEGEGGDRAGDGGEGEEEGGDARFTEGASTAAAALAASEDADDDDNSLGNEERTAHTNASSEEVLVKAEPSYEDFAMDEAVDAIWSSELTHNFDHGNSSDLPHVGDDVQRQANEHSGRCGNSHDSPSHLLRESSFDVIVSNCALNLSLDKAAVLDNAYALLKPGGELHITDVFCTQRVPQELRDDPLLWAECLSGALYGNDFVRLARECGFADPRLVSSTPLKVKNAELEERIARCMPSPRAGALFHSATYRLFKIPALEPAAENYGQAVQYLGTMPYPRAPGEHANCMSASAGFDAMESTSSALLPPPLPLSTLQVMAAVATPSQLEGLEKNDGEGSGEQIRSGALDATAAISDSREPCEPQLLSTFVLDARHRFPTGMMVAVSGNTYRMLHETRFRPHFQFYGGEFTQHFGSFEGDGAGSIAPF